MKKYEDKEYVNSMRTMSTIIEYYLKGKLETEIAALLNRSESEVKYVLGEENKNNIIHAFDSDIWKAIQQQREYNQTQIDKAFQKNFLYMSDRDLKYIIHSFLFTCKNIDDYCKLYHINQTLFQLHMLSEEYLSDKLGRKGKFVFEQIRCKIEEVTGIDTKKSREQEELFRLSVFYLDSLYTKEELIKKGKIDKVNYEYFLFNKETIIRLGNEELYQILLQHRKWIDEIRQKGNLPQGQYWVKDAHLRRILAENINSISPKALADLSILLAYYKHKGNLKGIQSEQKRNLKGIQKIIGSLDQYASILQLYLFQKLFLLSKTCDTKSTLLHGNPVDKPIDYQEEMKQKIEMIKTIASVGNVRPYWICGQIAAHNFLFDQTAMNLDIDESEIEVAFYCYMKELTTLSLIHI